MARQADLEKNGIAQAAILSAMLGMLTVGVVNLATSISGNFKEIVHSIGKIWMPGAEGIGPYSGKETVALAVWLISWIILHHFLRDKEVDNRLILFIFLVGLGLATTLVWPPVFEGIAHFLHR